MLLVCWEIDHYLLIFKRKRGVFHWFFHISWKVIGVFAVQYRGFDFIQWWYLYLKFLASILYFDLFDGDIVTLMQMLIFLHSVFEKIDFIRTMNKNVIFLINKMINLNVLIIFILRRRLESTFEERFTTIHCISYDEAHENSCGRMFTFWTGKQTTWGVNDRRQIVTDVKTNVFYGLGELIAL